MNLVRKLSRKYRVTAEVFKNTPWGVPDDITKLSEGIFWLDTPSHGGLAIKKTLALSLLPKEALDTFVGDWGTGNWIWYEEDSDSLIPLALVDGLFEKAKGKLGYTMDKEKIDQQFVANHKHLAQYLAQ